MSIVVVAGALANKLHNGGAAWTRLNYVLGLRKLGFDAYLVEQLSNDGGSNSSGRTRFEDSEQVRYFRAVAHQFDLDGHAVLIGGDGASTDGMCFSELIDLAGATELLVNISGHLTLDSVKSRIRKKAYVDLDPGFTQFWHAAGNDGARLAGHDFYFTVGENIGSSSCFIPAGEIAWQPTRQPVVLEYWPVSHEGRPDHFTTVASWRGPYGPVSYRNQTYGSKVRQFRKYAALPLAADGIFEIALDIHPNDFRDRDLLSNNRWNLVEPHDVASNPLSFRHYIQTSGAEFSVAQQVYVETGSGWFSDRTVRYLASGKPAVIEDTGFSRNYPVGDGILPFSNLEQAAAGVRAVTKDYPSHARAARQLAETYFDSDIVLGDLLTRTGTRS